MILVFHSGLYRMTEILVCLTERYLAEQQGLENIEAMWSRQKETWPDLTDIENDQSEFDLFALNV